MSLNFSGKNLRGLSFRGKNLTGADFSYADVRGVDFSNAILQNANFSHVQAGLQFRWKIALIIIPLFISIILRFVGWIVGRGTLGAIVIPAIVGVALISYIGWQTLVNNRQFFGIKNIIVGWSTIKGTKFCGADLTDADFSFAKLKYTDFRQATITRTNFHNSKNLDFARVNGTILIDDKVRDLVVSKRGANKSFIGCNLQGANLAGADLNAANLTAANLWEATLEGAWLEGCNLTRTQVVKTNFYQARLTGACLEAWNIDSTTNLEGVICDFVYLLNNHRERRPSSGNFAVCDFTKIFQPVLHTVDLIFRKGINLEALMSSFQKLNIEYKAGELSIRSIENIGDGVVLVRVQVPVDVNKEQIHNAVLENYKLALQEVDDKYQDNIRSQNSKLENWSDFADNLDKNTTGYSSGKLVVIKLEDGDDRTGFTVTLQMGEYGSLPSIESRVKLPYSEQIIQFYKQWRASYRRSIEANFRLTIPDSKLTNLKRNEVFNECISAAETWKICFNNWLKSPDIWPIKEWIIENINYQESLRIIIETENEQLRCLPWNIWDLFEQYPYAEIGLSSYRYQKNPNFFNPKNKVKVLVIIGNERDINVKKYQAMVEEIPDAQVTFMVEPEVWELNDNLWEKNWDIVFFGSHSYRCGDTGSGKIYINQTEGLTIKQLKHSLRTAIAHGLRLAIFNCIDGLELAANLSTLHFPQIIVMREPLPEIVAQEFLNNFLTAFASGKPLYQSVREAREKLRGWEDIYPCVTWLPVICQNPLDIPVNWEQMKSS
ncbi:MAG: pentapeptide repeat-containing protein [Nostocaceae cyanobacterium]|nr:pentapeptide repeat-containing protein [Nostocaceae cyanobacterium]